MTFPRTLPPGSTIGILGGGQLGRMTAFAAARLGYRVHAFADSADDPAAQVAGRVTVAGLDDRAALEAFAGTVDVATYEFENIPIAAVDAVARHTAVRPSREALRISQHRRLEKEFCAGLGIATAPFRPAGSLAELEAAVAAIGRPAVLKTCRFGYDGKGQIAVRAATDLAAAWAELATEEAILEGFIEFAGETSVIVARGLDGATAVWPPVDNRHEHHILAESRAPAALAPSLAVQAGDIARRLAEALDLVGLLAVEMFVTTDGRLLVNEMAPRPHNSGHWTIEGSETSQFEQLVRAICGLPLGPTGMRARRAVMRNLIGDAVAAWPSYLADPRAHLHLYGKAEARPGRKMGHVTYLED